MTEKVSTSQGLQPWHLPAMRAVAALTVGLPLPFIQLHSPLVGLIALAVLAGGTAVALWFGRRALPAGALPWPLAAAAWSAAIALVALVVTVVAPSATGLGVAVALWALPTGAIEGYAWWRMRSVSEPRTARLARDWRAVAVFTVILGLVFAVVRDAVTLTGMLGAFAVIVGVYHALAALSARPARTEARSDA